MSYITLMKTTLIIAILLFAVSAVAYLRREPNRTPSGQSSNNPYADLRGRALAVTPSDLALHVNAEDTWGVLMDVPVSGATATVVAFADGAASIYLSSGGGFIGGGEAPSIAMAAKQLLKAANQARDAFSPATTHPLPEPGRIRFYAHVGNVVRTAEASEDELQAGRHPLSSVYAAGQDVITAYRETQSQLAANRQTLTN